MSVKQRVSRTNSKGIVAKAGRYGGTYVYKDIAFEFVSWVSPQFKLYLIKEFERLKKEEQALLGCGSSIARAFKAHSEQGLVFNLSSAL